MGYIGTLSTKCSVQHVLRRRTLISWIIVAAHGNSLRSIVMHLEKMSKEQVLELNIPTGTPIVYEMGADLKILSKKIL